MVKSGGSAYHATKLKRSKHYDQIKCCTAETSAIIPNPRFVERRRIPFVPHEFLQQPLSGHYTSPAPGRQEIHAPHGRQGCARLAGELDDRTLVSGAGGSYDPTLPE